MATVSGEIDIHATPAAILDVLADLGNYPQWSAVHKRTSVQSRFPDGRPQRATMAVTAAGLTDEQVLDYSWSTSGVSWDLVRSTSQRGQHGSYTITRGPKGASHVRYDLDISPAIPVPGIVVRQVMRKAVSAATSGLRDRVESLAR
jgi:hypothetical protein